MSETEVSSPSLLGWSLLGLLPALIYYFLFKRSYTRKDAKAPIRIPLSKMDFKNQSVLLPGRERIRAASWGNPADNPSGYLATVHADVRTVYDAFVHGLKISKNGDCIGTPDQGSPGGYSWMKYQDVLDKAHDFGAGLVNIGAAPGQATVIGVYSPNRLEYNVAMLAIAAHSRIVVPLYDTLGPEALAYIVGQTQMKYCICDTATKARSLLATTEVKTESNYLRHVILMEDTDYNDVKSEFESSSVFLHSFSELEKSGAVSPVPLDNKPQSEDTFIVCYTSGTTGAPKGVELSHGSLIAEAAVFEVYLKQFTGLDLSPENVHTTISYLPLAHMFEQMMHVSQFGMGYRIGYFRGDVKGLTEDMKILKPTIMPVVPRLLNRINDSIQGKLESGSRISRWLWNVAYSYKFAQAKQGILRWDSLFDKLIYDKIRAQVGGRMDIMITGSAPIAGDVLNSCRVAFGCSIVEGYGQTETTTGCSLTLPGDYSTGHVGGAMPCCHIKLVDVPDLNYFAKDDEGEICVRGPTVMKGYFRDPVKTAETIDADGWLHTGDIGAWQANGTLKLIDRKKHIFKLAQGEYVAPEKIESIYVRCPVVMQIFVDGNSLERQLVAIVVPDEGELRLLAQEILHTAPDRSRVAEWTFEALCAHDGVSVAVLERMRIMAKENRLNSIEQVAAIHLTSEQFSVENGLMTPTFKSMRPKLRKFYQETIDELYIKLNRKYKSVL